MNCHITALLLVFTVFLISQLQPVSEAEQKNHKTKQINFQPAPDQIQPYSENPWYWQYRGEPLVLRGGSGTDNLFQWTGERLTGHLDLLVSVGGNYVRNTMSDRSAGDVYAFKEIEEGLYDLDQWNEEYWDRLRFFLDETHKRGVIVQLTLWDQFDLGGENWLAHPWVPENNVNLQSDVMRNRDHFYNSVEKNVEEVLYYQNRYVNEVLSLTLEYDNVLYNINNESSEGAVWENYWAAFLLDKAAWQNKTVFVTTMQFDPSNSVRQVLTYPELYSFVEISQNNQDSRGGRGPAHWENIINWREKIASHRAGPMPMNNEKVYGAYDGRNYSSGTGLEAEARFWKNIFAGAASSRFHRDEGHWGIGLQERAQMNIKAMAMFLEEFDIFNAAPHNDLLSSYVTQRNSMEAYCLANIGRQYAIYFPAGRFTIDLDPWVYVNRVRVKWLDMDTAAWSDEEVIEVEWSGSLEEWGDRGSIRLTTPGNRVALVLLEVVE